MLDIAKEIVCGPRIDAGCRSRAYRVRHLTKNYIVETRLNEVHGWRETPAHNRGLRWGKEAECWTRIIPRELGSCGGRMINGGCPFVLLIATMLGGERHALH